MRLLVLGGTHFLGRHVVTTALQHGHEVATFTRGVSGEPAEGALALHGDRDDPDALPRALDGVTGYAFVSSLNAYRGCHPAPSARRTAKPPGTPTATSTARSRRTRNGSSAPSSAAGSSPPAPASSSGPTTRSTGSAGGSSASPGVGGWSSRSRVWTSRSPRDLAAWLVAMAERGRGGAVNATGPAGMTTLGGLLDHCRAVTGGRAEWVPVPEADLLGAGVEEWTHLPLWLRRQTARTAWDVDTTRARELGLPSRPLRSTVADTCPWLRSEGTPTPPAGPPGRCRTGLGTGCSLSRAGRWAGRPAPPRRRPPPRPPPCCARRRRWRPARPGRRPTPGHGPCGTRGRTTRPQLPRPG